MESQSPGSSGLLGSLRGFADGLISSVHDRIELFSVELQEEKHRLIQTFIWAAAVVMLALLTVLFASFALVALFWETARVAVVSILLAVYLAGLIAAIVGLQRFLKRQPKPFQATMAELREDRSCMQTES